MTTATIKDLKAFPEVLKGTIVAEEERLDFWPSMYDGSIFAAMKLEGFIFANTDKMVTNYDGGYWEFVILDYAKKIYYIYPASDEPMEVEGDLNHASETIDNRIFGIIVTLLSLAWLGDITGDERLYAAYRNLHGYVFDTLGDIMGKYEGTPADEWPVEVKQASNAMNTVYKFLD